MANDQIPGFTPDSAVANATAPIAGFTSDAEVAQQTSAAPDRPSALSRTVTGIEQGVQEFTAPVTPADHKEALVSFLGGPGALAVYKGGKAIVNSVENIAKPSTQTPTPGAYQKAVEDFHQALQHVTNKDYRNAAASTGSAVGDLASTMPGPGQFFGPQIRDVSEGTRPGADLATPLARSLTKDALLGVSIFGLPPNPFRSAAADTTIGDAASVTDKAEPLEVKATQATRKVGLPEGRTATSDVEVKQALENQAKTQVDNQAAAGKQVQANLQTGLRETWNNVADENNVPRPSANISIREAGQQVGDSIYARSKTSYKLIDNATDGKFQPNADALKNVNLKLRDIVGTDDAAEAKLMAQKQRLLWQQDQLFDDAAKNGVPKETVDSAKSDFKKAQAIYDTNYHIRMTTTGLPPDVPGAVDNPEIVKSGNLMNRLVKDYSPTEGGAPGRLTQAVGDENAHNLLSHTSAAQVAENKLLTAEIDKDPELSALPATESKALREIIRPNVKAGTISGTNVDWKKSLDDFNKMTPQELKARFSDPDAIRQSLRRQATIHNVKTGLGAVTGLGSAIGVEELIRRNLP